MLFNNPNHCTVCGYAVSFGLPCVRCEDIAKLKDVTCPCCKGSNIFISKQYQSNNIIGPGSSSWVTSENFVCKTCGIMFLDAKKFA